MTIFRLYKEIFIKSSKWNIAVFQLCAPIQQREPIIHISQFSSVTQSSLSLWSMVCSNQASLSITNSQSLLKLQAIESVMPSNYIILYSPLLLSSSVFPSIRYFWVGQFFASGGLSIGASASPCRSNEYPGLISFRMEWCDLLAVQGTLMSLLQ